MKSWKQAKSLADKNSVIADDKGPRYLLEIIVETFEFTKSVWLKICGNSQKQKWTLLQPPKPEKQREKIPALEKPKCKKMENQTRTRINLWQPRDVVKRQFQRQPNHKKDIYGRA